MERTNLLQRIMQRHWKTSFVFLSRTGSIRQGRINRLGNVRVRESRQGWDVNKDFTTTMHRAERLSQSILLLLVYSPIDDIFVGKKCKRKIAPALEAIQFYVNSHVTRLEG